MRQLPLAMRVKTLPSWPCPCTCGASGIYGESAVKPFGRGLSGDCRFRTRCAQASMRRSPHGGDAFRNQCSKDAAIHAVGGRLRAAMPLVGVVLDRQLASVASLGFSWGFVVRGKSALRAVVPFFAKSLVEPLRRRPRLGPSPLVCGSRRGQRREGRPLCRAGAEVVTSAQRSARREGRTAGRS